MNPRSPSVVATAASLLIVVALHPGRVAASVGPAAASSQDASGGPTFMYLDVYAKADDAGDMTPRIGSGPAAAEVAVWLCQKSRDECHPLWSSTEAVFKSKHITLHEVVTKTGKSLKTTLTVKGLVTHRRNLKALTFALKLVGKAVGATPAAALTSVLDGVASELGKEDGKEKKRSFEQDFELEISGKGIKITECLDRDRTELSIATSGQACKGLRISLTPSVFPIVSLTPPAINTCHFSIDPFRKELETKRSRLTAGQLHEEESTVGALVAAKRLCTPDLDSVSMVDAYYRYLDLRGEVPPRYKTLRDNLDKLVVEERTSGDLRTHVGAIATSSTAAALAEAAGWLEDNSAAQSLAYRQCKRFQAEKESTHIRALDKSRTLETGSGCADYLKQASISDDCPTCVGMVKQQLELHSLADDAAGILKGIHEGAETAITSLNSYSSNCRALTADEASVKTNLEGLRTQTLDDALSKDTTAKQKLAKAKAHLNTSNEYQKMVRTILSQTCPERVQSKPVP